MNEMRSRTGVVGEEIASRFLADKGYNVVERNYRTRGGEIDIIATVTPDGITTPGRYIFVEVKTRTGRKFGYPEESVTRDKLAHIIAAAQAYINEHELFGNEWQIDIISIEIAQDQQRPKITHFQNVTSALEWDG